MTNDRKPNNGRTDELRRVVGHLANTMSERIKACSNLARTRTALIEPVIADVLAFDVRNPLQVDPCPEELEAWRKSFQSAEGTSNASIYVLMNGGKAVMYVIAQAATEPLPSDATMTTPVPDVPAEAMIAWTNGRRWAFVARTTSADEPNATVIHDFDFLDHDPSDVDDFEPFTLQGLSDLDARQRIFAAYTERRIAVWLQQQLRDPDTKFADFAATACHTGRKTAQVMTVYREALPRAIETVLRALRAGSQNGTSGTAPEGTKMREQLVGCIQGKVRKRGRGAAVARWLMGIVAENTAGARTIDEIAQSGRYANLQTDPHSLPESRRELAQRVPHTNSWFTSGASISDTKRMLDDILDRLPATHPLSMSGYSTKIEYHRQTPRTQRPKTPATDPKAGADAAAPAAAATVPAAAPATDDHGNETPEPAREEAATADSAGENRSGGDGDDNA